MPLNYRGKKRNLATVLCMEEYFVLL